jgi:hypothetical protein
MITKERKEILSLLIKITKEKLKVDLRDTKYYSLESLIGQITGTTKISNLSEKQAEALELFLMMM